MCDRYFHGTRQFMEIFLFLVVLHADPKHRQEVALERLTGNHETSHISCCNLLREFYIDMYVDIVTQRSNQNQCGWQRLKPNISRNFTIDRHCTYHNFLQKHCCILFQWTITDKTDFHRYITEDIPSICNTKEWTNVFWGHIKRCVIMHILLTCSVYCKMSTLQINT